MVARADTTCAMVVDDIKMQPNGDAVVTPPATKGKKRSSVRPIRFERLKDESVQTVGRYRLCPAWFFQRWLNDAES